MYAAFDDPYCYPGTDTLKNRLNLRDPDALAAFEAEISAQRADEPLPAGRLGVRHFCAVHRHLFQDVYEWAGRFRTIRLAKDGSAFCYPENIPGQIEELFDWLRTQNFLRQLGARDFAAALAHFLAVLNAIHAFREGNGRTQLIFAALLAARAGHPLDLAKLDPERFLAAMITSFKGDEAPLAVELGRLIDD